MRISYSGLETFKQCPLKFKLQYLDRLKTPKSKEALFGTLLHSALKILHEPGLLAPTEEEILKYIADNWDPAVYETENESVAAFALAIKIMNDYYAKNYPSQFNILALETPFEVPLAV
ncbi:MAG: PD-(D/E)XK nuclease family protein [Patescibacteria group bacterium]